MNNNNLNPGKPVKSKKKVPLAPGRSLAHWVQLAKENPGLIGPPDRPMRDVSSDELAKHCTEEDCWMAIRGKVYDVTPYIPFHPGGFDEIFMAAGDDGTALFNENHAWVNIENLLKVCVIGKYVGRQAKSQNQPPS